jgi:hypothetical protein
MKVDARSLLFFPTAYTPIVEGIARQVPFVRSVVVHSLKSFREYWVNRMGQVLNTNETPGAGWRQPQTR